MPRPQRGLRWPGCARGSPSSATAGSRRCDRCGSRAVDDRPARRRAAADQGAHRHRARAAARAAARVADRRLLEVCAGFRPDRAHAGDPATATKIALRSLARRHQALTEEIDDLDALLAPLVADINPELLAANGVEVAGQLLVSAGENSDRLTSEAAFAMLCGVAPIPASSGKTNRHRLNRGGDRQANAALYRVVLCRMRWDPRTRDYVARRTVDGLSKPEIIRCLKRYVARELFTLINPTTTENDLVSAA